VAADRHLYLRFGIGAFLLSCLVSVSSQEAAPDLHGRVVTVVLEASGAPLPTTEQLDAVLAPVLCDQDQNLYFRKLGADSGSSPLIRIAANGRSSAKFDPDKLSGNSRGTDLVAFTVDTLGRVHGIVRLVEANSTIGSYLVVYTKNGEVASKTKLEVDFIPSAFTALESGDYFVSGITVKKARDDVSKPVTALLDGSGRVKINLATPEEDHVARSKKTQQRGGSSAEPSPQLSAIENGTSVYGSDKNVYLFRATNPVRMKILSPAGTILRELELKAPVHGAEPFEFRVAGNRVLVGFRPARTGKEPSAPESIPLYVIFDSESAEPMMHYRFGASIRGALACFTGDRFQFLTGTRDGRFAILDAKTK
jgi:hypothetical protein